VYLVGVEATADVVDGSFLPHKEFRRGHPRPVTGGLSALVGLYISWSWESSPNKSHEFSRAKQKS
jgi:hypothetical protein